MKKLALVLAFLLIVPGAAFGLEMMNDTSMDDVTGQSGVAITVDDVQIFMNIDRVAWLDCDGYNCNTGNQYTNDGGAVGIGNFQLDVLKVNAPDSATASTTAPNGATLWDLTNANPCSEIDLQYDYGDTTTSGTCSLASSSGGAGTQTLGLNNYTSVGDPLATTGSSRYIPHALTINATSRLPVLTFAKSSIAGSNKNIGGIIIGLPTVEINIPTLSLTPAFYDIDGAQAAENAKNTDDACDYGTVVLDDVTMTVLSGWVEIAPLCSD